MEHLHDKIRRMVSEGLRTGEIAKILNMKKGAVSYYRKKLRLPVQEQQKGLWEIERLAETVQSDISLGLTYDEITYKHNISKSAIFLGISRGCLSPKKTMSDLSTSELCDLYKNKRATSGFRRLIRKSMLAQPGRFQGCEMCKNEVWLGRRINLEVDHIDGNSSNNDAANLRLLCLNCHSQTPTWRGRNTKKAKLVNSHSEVGITTGFGPVMAGPNPAESTTCI